MLHFGRKRREKGDVTIKALIDKALENTSVTVVFVGSQTAGRKYINYEIDRSIARGNGIVAVQIHHLKDKNGLVDPAGAIPAKITTGGYKVYKVHGPRIPCKVDRSGGERRWALKKWAGCHLRCRLATPRRRRRGPRRLVQNRITHRRADGCSRESH